MLGYILAELTDATAAEGLITAMARPEIVERLERAAAVEGVSAGALAASRLRHLIEHGSEDIWLDLLGAMSGSPQPGAVAVDRLLTRAFPDPVRVRISRRTA